MNFVTCLFLNAKNVKVHSKTGNGHYSIENFFLIPTIPCLLGKILPLCQVKQIWKGGSWEYWKAIKDTADISGVANGPFWFYGSSRYVTSFRYQGRVKSLKAHLPSLRWWVAHSQVNGGMGEKEIISLCVEHFSGYTVCGNHNFLAIFDPSCEQIDRSLTLVNFWGRTSSVPYVRTVRECTQTWKKILYCFNSLFLIDFMTDFIFAYTYVSWKADPSFLPIPTIPLCSCLRFVHNKLFASVKKFYWKV